MPQLPALPELTQEQFDYLVDLFSDMAPGLGEPGPAEAYVRWSLNNLISLVQANAHAQVRMEIDAITDARMSEVDAMLADLIGGASPAQP